LFVDFRDGACSGNSGFNVITASLRGFLTVHLS